MAREAKYFRDNLESLRAYFPGKEMVSVPEAARYLGTTKESLFADDTFPILRLGKQSRVVLVNMAGWLATEAAH